MLETINYWLPLIQYVFIINTQGTKMQISICNDMITVTSMLVLAYTFDISFPISLFLYFHINIFRVVFMESQHSCWGFIYNLLFTASSFCCIIDKSSIDSFHYMLPLIYVYRKASNISRTSVGNKIVDHSDVVGASPVGTAPSTSWFWHKHMASMDWTKTTTRRDEEYLSVGIWWVLH